MADRNQGIVGRAIPRVDGPLKVTGRADYSADHPIEPRPYVGWIVESSIGPGRIRALDVSKACAAPGVIEVLTHHNAPEQRPYGEPSDEGRFTQSHALLQTDQLRYHGQPIALVIAETLEQARGAALEIEVAYDADHGRFAVDGNEPNEDLEQPDSLDGGQDPDVIRGDFAEALEASDVVVDRTFTTPDQISAAMEPHATIAQWDGETLTVHTSIQVVANAVEALANTLKLDPDKIRVRSPFVGGGFGSKLGIHSDAVLACLGTLALEHPVKVVQSRRNVFSNGPHRGSSVQRVRLGATADGRLLAVGHDSIMPMSRGYEFAEPVAASARASYACDALHTTHRVVKVDMPPIDSMRAPGEAIGTLALEIAMDELATALKMDPLELRLRNVADREPMSGRPFASNDLRRCLERGAERFGWAARASGGRRQGRWRLGWGMAACTRFSLLMKASASVELRRDGRAVARLDMTDIGTGSYTIFRQIVADELGLTMDEVDVQLGDSNHPQTSGSGGSFGAASSGGAVLRACRELRKKLVTQAVGHPDTAMVDTDEDDAQFVDGTLRIGDEAMPLGEIVALEGETLEAEGSVEPQDASEEHAQYSYGAHFVELAVDDVSGEVRLRRVVGAFSFGRVLNEITARSQLIGAMTYGIGGALTESLALDPRYGAFMNRDFAEYHLAVNRDVPDIDVLMLGEPDERCGPLGSKGLGELGLCGIAGAISNAVFDATGVRVRDVPITPDRVLAGLV